LKILFLTTNFSYKRGESYVGAGWASSLITHLIAVSNCDIAVAFFSDKVTSLTIEKGDRATQYVVPSYVNKLEKLKRNYKLTDYLFEERLDTILNVVNNFRPDIIHVFGSENPFGGLVKKVSVPIVIHLQGILNPLMHKWFPTGYSIWDLMKVTPITRLLMLSGYFGDYIRYNNMANREKVILKNARYFTGRTDWDRRIVTMMSDCPTYFHGEELLRTSFYNRKWIRKNNDTVKIISVVNANIYKGLETVFEAAEILKLFTKKDFLWVIVGVEKKNALVKMFSKRKTSSITDTNIRFLGSLQETDLVEEMSSADIFVHPSHIDNSPNSVCEAMMLGMPVISTSVGGVQSILQNNLEGILVQDGEPYGMAASISELIEDPVKAEKLGLAARERAIIRHEPSKIVESVLKMYTEILAQHNA
jgi:glycosyltransferase involved in cell wall biosynthesis